MSVKRHSRWKVFFLLFSRRVVLSSLFCFNKHVHEVVTEAHKPFQGLSPLAPDGKSKEITKSQLTSWLCSTNRDTLNSLWFPACVAFKCWILDSKNATRWCRVQGGGCESHMQEPWELDDGTFCHQVLYHLIWNPIPKLTTHNPNARLMLSG